MTHAQKRAFQQCYLQFNNPNDDNSGCWTMCPLFNRTDNSEKEIDTPGDGNCLFHAILASCNSQDNSILHNMSANQLRKEHIRWLINGINTKDEHTIDLAKKILTNLVQSPYFEIEKALNTLRGLSEYQKKTIRVLVQLLTNPHSVFSSVNLLDSMMLLLPILSIKEFYCDNYSAEVIAKMYNICICIYNSGSNRPNTTYNVQAITNGRPLVRLIHYTNHFMAIVPVTNIS